MKTFLRNYVMYNRNTFTLKSSGIKGQHCLFRNLQGIKALVCAQCKKYFIHNSVWKLKNRLQQISTNIHLRQSMPTVFTGVNFIIRKDQPFSVQRVTFYREKK